MDRGRKEREEMRGLLGDERGGGSAGASYEQHLVSTCIQEPCVHVTLRTTCNALRTAVSHSTTMSITGHTITQSSGCDPDRPGFRVYNFYFSLN